MKLKDTFITHDIDDTQFLISLGDEKFNKIVRSNSSAAYIVNLLKEEITEEEIVEKMTEKYDAPKDVIAADVADVIKTLSGLDALE